MSGREEGGPGGIAPHSFALLDDMTAGDEARSGLYTELVEAHAIVEVHEVGRLLEHVERGLAEGLHPIGLFAYELGAQWQRVGQHRLVQPLAQVLLFKQCRWLTDEQVRAWLQERATEGAAGIANVRPSVSRGEFHRAIDAVRTYIAAGDAYQVNYTYRIDLDAYGSPEALYARLRQRQRVPYGALIALPDHRVVVSLSPELFLSHTAGRIHAKPMKGTARAGATSTLTRQAAAALAADPKNRAENLMIVDLLRNDIGRLAVTGSVKVPSLFDVTRFGDVLQMTSTVEADLEPATRLEELFEATFPCGSITGAPKRRSMQIIHELETRPRGLYTGGIACFDPPVQPGAMPDLCMSVPIRTLVLEPPMGGVRAGVLGVGAGIVADSDAESEFEECRLKAGFLTNMPGEFELLETIFASAGEGCRHLGRHLARLQSSAAYFGFPVDLAAVELAAKDAARTLAPGCEARLRLTVSATGAWSIASSMLDPVRDSVDVLLDPRPVDSSDLFLRHKTTERGRLDLAWQMAEAQGAFDSLLFNERGELTQGGRSNVFLRLDGRWTTPPLRCGVLGGVMRAVMLESAAWNATERVILRKDLDRAGEIVVCNALRGPLRARLALR